MSTYYDPPVTVEDSEASQARWSGVVEECWPGVRVFYADGYYDWQGSAEIVGTLPDGRYLVAGWSYGSCSGCDGYEGLYDEELRQEFSRNGEVFGRDALLAYAAALRADDDKAVAITRAVSA